MLKKLKLKIYPNNKHQVVALPANGKVNEVFICKIDKFVQERYSKKVDDFITKVSFYNNEQGKYFSFVPNFTNEKSSHNFDLISYEDDALKINSFVVSTKKFDEELVFEMDVDI